MNPFGTKADHGITMNRRYLLLSSVAAGAIAAIGVPEAVAAPASTMPRHLTTLTLVNTSSLPQAAGFVTPMFGCAFKKGDVPAGDAPQFKVSGLTQPYSWGCQAHWSDGSLKFASFIMRSTASIPGSGTLRLEVWSGGTPPSASMRSLTEVYAQALQVNVTGAGSNFGLTGTWAAVLAGNDNNLEQFVYLDGDAGRVWRILTNFVSAGSAHGQLVCYHYIAALTDASGGLGGFRHLARICQPWYDLDRPAKNWRGFTSVSWQHGSVPTTVPLIWPFNAAVFTWVSGANFQTTSPNNFWNGGVQAGNLIPGYLRTTGTLPAGLSETQIYFLNATSNSTTKFILNKVSGNSNGDARATDGGTGTHTFNPIPLCLHFGSLFTATANATWNFFQGAGSTAVDHTVRIKYDATYFRAAKVLPPYDLTVPVVRDYWKTNFDWNPVSIGPLYLAVGSPGDIPDLGPINSYHAVHVYVQDAIAEKVMRMIGLAYASWCGAVRDSTTRTLVNVGDPAKTYKGMPTSVANTLQLNEAGGMGFVPPPRENNAWVAETSNSHKPSMAYYPYLVTGEPQYLDLMDEAANQSIWSRYIPARNPVAPFRRYGVVTAYGGDSAVRAMAWGNRDIQHCAGLHPTVSPDYTAFSTYIQDLAKENSKFPVQSLASLQNPYCITNGNWIGWLPGQYIMPNSSWMTSGYFHSAMCIGAALNESSDALSWLQSYQKWLEHKRATFGGYTLTAYYERTIKGPDADGTPEATNAQMAADDTDYAMAIGALIMWTNSSQAFTITELLPGWTLTNGDKFIFLGNASTRPAGFSIETPYYAINVSGNRCDLSVTPGGSPIIPRDVGTIRGGDIGGTAWGLPINPPAVGTGQVASGHYSSGSYVANVHGASCWSKAVGTAGLDAVIADCAARMGVGGTKFVTDPRWALQTTF